MSDPYEIRTQDGGVWMDFREFIRLVEHLQTFGVDAKVQAQEPGRAVFTLSEASSDQ